MLIRPFQPHDAAPACALTNLSIARTHILFALRPATTDEFHALWLAGSATHPWLAADVDGAFAGYAKASPWREREAYARTAETAVYVEPAFHRRGVGRALYHELLASLRAQGFHTAVAGIALPNDPSVALHESCGFTHVGTFREVGRKFDHWWDVGFWQVALT